MYFVLLAAAVAILTGVVAVAMGWGGEMALARRDLPMAPLRIRTASDLATLRLPLGLFGYQEQTADEALHVVAGLLAERDAEIARLRAEVHWLGEQRNGNAWPVPPVAVQSGAVQSGAVQAAAVQAAAVAPGAVSPEVVLPAAEPLSGHSQAGGQSSPPR